MVFSLINGLFELFNFHTFANFPKFLLLLIFNVIPLWPENVLHMISILLSSFVLWPNKRLSWRTCHVHLRRMYILLLSDGMFYRYQLSPSGLMRHLRPVFPYWFLSRRSVRCCKWGSKVLRYCWLLLWLLAVALCGAPMLGAYIFTIVRSSWIDPLNIM